MGTIKFFDGMDEPTINPGSTQPGEPGASGYGKVKFIPDDNEPTHSYDKTEPSWDAKGGMPQRLPDNQFDSPLDK